MNELTMLFAIGDMCNDGHGKYDIFPIKVTIQNQDKVEEFENELEYAETLIEEKYDIDLSTWFSEYEDNSIPQADVEKLKQLNIDIDVAAYYDKNGLVYLCGTEDYFKIWKQLVEKVNPNIQIEKIEMPTFYGNCTGYGLFL